MRKIIVKHHGFILMVCLLVTACGAPETKKEVKSSKSGLKSAGTKPETTFIELDRNALETLTKSDEIRIYADDDSAFIFTLNIRRVDEAIKGIRSISAYVDDSETGQAVLILRKGRLSGYMDLYSRNKKYRLAYQTTSGRYFLQEVNKDSLDILEGGEPLAPRPQP
ncbi:hypothetical protein [Gracilimonas tropica]|uniref:hypothetical protein n=1 Tax=Gracilimonas tropica TaxID=454600 RepID=UPI00036982A4|nr:hypothetical protein [Gracilimonas tropica]